MIIKLYVIQKYIYVQGSNTKWNLWVSMVEIEWQIVENKCLRNLPNDLMMKYSGIFNPMTVEPYWFMTFTFMNQKIYYSDCLELNLWDVWCNLSYLAHWGRFDFENWRYS